MDSKDTLFSLGCREKKGAKLLMQMFWICYGIFFFLTTQAIKKWSLDCPSKVLSSSYFSIHHTGEINPEENSFPFRLVFVRLCQITYICLFLLRCLWFLCENVQKGVWSLLMFVCVWRGGDPWGAQFRSTPAVRVWGSATGQSLHCLWG